MQELTNKKVKAYRRHEMDFKMVLLLLRKFFKLNILEIGYDFGIVSLRIQFALCSGISVRCASVPTANPAWPQSIRRGLNLDPQAESRHVQMPGALARLRSPLT